MHKLVLIAAALVFTAAANAAAPPDTLPGTIHFDSGSSHVKARASRHRHHVRHTGNATLNYEARRDGTGKN